MAAVVARLSTLDALAEQALNIESIDDLLSYSAELIEWRQELWSKVPFCAESVEISLIATNAASDFAAYFALALAGEPVDITLYRESGLQGLAMVGSQLAGTGSVDDGSVAVTQEDSLPACTESAKESLHAFGEQMQLFAYFISEFDSVDDIMTFGEVQITWRDQIWEKIPPCQEAIKAGQLVIQLTGDTVPGSALLFFLDVPEADNPYLGEILSARDRVEAFSTMFGSE